MIRKLKLDINGEQWVATIRNSDTLLDVLREKLDFTGAKRGCENGDCGSCTVIADGLPVKTCMMLAVDAVGKELTTIEGLHDTPMQHAFVDKWAFQCGYCTSGFILNATALVEQHPDATDEIMEEWLSSNICRCTSYQEIREAVKSVLEEQRTKKKRTKNRG